MEKKLRGTAAMSPEKRAEVARKGGLAISKNREEMARRGSKGGQTVVKRYGRERMAMLGKLGGKANAKRNQLTK